MRPFVLLICIQKWKVPHAARGKDDAMLKQRIKNYAVCLLAPGAALLLLTVFFSFTGIYPFGKYAISWCDMNQQVLPFLLDLKDILSGQGNLFLNMQNGGGMNFWGVFLFFLSSPFSLLTVFVDKQDMQLFMNVLVGLKMAACALAASVFFRYRLPRLKWYCNVILGVMYAFCGFALLFYQNVMWLDIMYLFPLLVLALDRLAKKDKPLLYMIVLTLCIAVNFYMSYMLVLCILFYMGLFLLLYKQENRKRAASTFCISSLCACLLSAPFWMPALSQYMSSARTVGLIESITSGAWIGYIYTVWPLLFCTAVFVPAILLTVRHLRERDIRLYFSLFLLTAVPLVVEPVNKMWHTGNYMAFPARYGYMTAFFALVLLGFAMDRLSAQHEPRRIASRHTASVLLPVCAVLCAGAAAIVLFFYSGVQAYIQTLWGDMESFFILGVVFLLVCGAYGCILYVWKKGKLRVPAAAGLLALVLVCECMLNCGVYLAAPRHDDLSYRQVMDLAGKTADDGFYRVKTDKKRYDVNLTGAAGYNTLGHYSSLTSEDYLYTMKKLGYSAYWMEVSSSGGTLFSDMLLSNRYTIGNPLLDGAFYRNASFAIRENDVFLPPALLTGSDLSNHETLPRTGRLETQQYLCEKLFGETGLFHRYEPREAVNASVSCQKGKGYTITAEKETGSELVYEIPVGQRTTLYFDCFDRVSTSLVEEVNGAVSVEADGRVISESYPSQQENGILELGSFENETVRVVVKLNKSLACKSFGLYGLKEAALQNIAQRARTAAIQVNGNTIEADCTAQKDEALILFFPNDKGYTATVNGEPAEINRVFGGWMSIKLPQGKAHVVLTFVPGGMWAGLIICGAGVLLCTGYAVFRRKKCSVCGTLERACFLVTLGAAGLAAAAVYIAPVLIKLLC